VIRLLEQKLNRFLWCGKDEHAKGSDECYAYF